MLRGDESAPPTPTPGLSRRVVVRRHSFKRDVLAEAAQFPVRAGGSSSAGWLLKQSSGTFKRWQRRYFQLNGKFLRYFAGPEALMAKGAIRLCDLESVAREVHHERGAPNTQLITLTFTDGSFYLLKASDAFTASEWVRDLEVGMKHGGAVPALGMLREEGEEDGVGNVVEHLHTVGEPGPGAKLGFSSNAPIATKTQFLHVLASVAMWWFVVALVHRPLLLAS